MLNSDEPFLRQVASSPEMPYPAFNSSFLRPSRPCSLWVQVSGPNQAAVFSQTGGGAGSAQVHMEENHIYASADEGRSALQPVFPRLCTNV